MKPTGKPNAAIGDGSSAPKPTAKANLIRQQILFALLEGKYLAKHVSWENVDILAKRWAR